MSDLVPRIKLLYKLCILISVYLFMKLAYNLKWFSVLPPQPIPSSLNPYHGNVFPSLRIKERTYPRMRRKYLFGFFFILRNLKCDASAVTLYGRKKKKATSEAIYKVKICSKILKKKKTYLGIFLDFL